MGPAILSFNRRVVLSSGVSKTEKEPQSVFVIDNEVAGKLVVKYSNIETLVKYPNSSDGYIPVATEDLYKIAPAQSVKPQSSAGYFGQLLLDERMS